MGRAVKQLPRRTIVAMVLTVAVVLVPYGAWYVTGSSKIDSEAQRAVEDVGREARAEASNLAGFLAVRLEQLRQSEQGRPFYHYQNLYHDPRGAHQGASIVPSPLAQGSSDPFILGHFQIGPDGDVRLPTLNERVPELNTPRQPQVQRQLLVTLRQAAATIRQAADALDAQTLRTVTMPQSAWHQNREAVDIYLRLKRDPSQADDATRTPSDDTVTIAVGPLVWRTIDLDDQPSLLAMRTVRTPAGVTVQGLVISRYEMRLWVGAMRQTALPVTLLIGRPPPRMIAAAFIGQLWWVTVRTDEVVFAAQRDAARQREAFVFEFCASALAAAIAGLCVIGLVYQSEKLARQRSRFAASAAHELRTPLAGLRMYGEMLAEQLGDPDNTRAYARRIADEAERLGRVVANVLGFSRLERGRLAVRPQYGDLPAAVRDAVARHQHAMDKAGVALDVRFGADLPPVRFDSDALAQVIQNLLDNAEKYSRGADNRTIEVALSRTAGGVALTVRDHGRGIDPKQKRSLFEPFHRGRDADDAPAGMGLGLTITRALVRAMRGRIEADNAAGGGAIFTVTLPA
jgi:signal transduction histidine kinase